METELSTNPQKDIQYSSGEIIVVPNKGKAHFCAVSFTGGQHYQSPCHHSFYFITAVVVEMHLEAQALS